MSDYKPGTVAVATVRGVPNVRVMKYGGDYWCSSGFVDGERFHPEDALTDVRPLVVLDLAGRDPRVLINVLRTYQILDLADQIEQQTRPPKPPEPTGLGAVVEDAEQIEYVHLGNGLWVYGTTDGASQGYRYSAIDAVKVLSEGVQS